MQYMFFVHFPPSVMPRSLFFILLICLTLCSCDIMRQDCSALAEREKDIAKEPAGDYYIGRRYYIPSTRFWGYLRRPGESWRTAKLVIMDEAIVRTPDRGYEPPVPGAIFGTDDNVEYTVCGSFTQEQAYDPSTDLSLPVFKPTKFTVRNKKPGFLFVPSEVYSEEYVTLRPQLIPSPERCRALLSR